LVGGLDSRIPAHFYTPVSRVNLVLWADSLALDLPMDLRAYLSFASPFLSCRSFVPALFWEPGTVLML